MIKVTHDLRTPLSTVNYIFDNIRKKCQNNKEIQNGIRIGKCCSNMLMNLINDILDYS